MSNAQTLGKVVSSTGLLADGILSSTEVTTALGFTPGDVTLTGTQTLTNKTLTAPVINGFTGNTDVVNIGSGQFVKDASGNVGIGTSSPGSKLDVRSGQFMLSTDNNRALSYGVTRSDTGSANGMASMNMFGSGTNGFLGNITFSTGGADLFNAALVERMRIDYSGNVGIGTSSPGSKLDVNGTVTATSFAGSGITLKGSSSGTTTFASANASATNYTLTFPASTGTVLTTATAVTVAQGGTGATTAAGALTNLGAYAASNPSSYITTAGARSALSFTAGSGAYNSTTGVITIPNNTNQLTNGAGYTTNTGDVTLTGTQTLTNKTLTSPVLNTATASGLTLNDGYTEEVFAVTGTTPALSPTNGSIQTWTLTANSTPTAGTWAEGQSIMLMVDDGTADTITWTSLAVTWETGGGTAPTLATTGYTVITLWKVGTTIYGAAVGV